VSRLPDALHVLTDIDFAIIGFRKLIGGSDFRVSNTAGHKNDDRRARRRFGSSLHTQIHEFNL
jgi:hypothetical protein